MYIMVIGSPQRYTTSMNNHHSDDESPQRYTTFPLTLNVNDVHHNPPTRPILTTPVTRFRGGPPSQNRKLIAKFGFGHFSDIWDDQCTHLERVRYEPGTYKRAGRVARKV